MPIAVPLRAFRVNTLCIFLMIQILFLLIKSRFKDQLNQPCSTKVMSIKSKLLISTPETIPVSIQLNEQLVVKER